MAEKKKLPFWEREKIRRRQEREWLDEEVRYLRQYNPDKTPSEIRRLLLSWH